MCLSRPYNFILVKGFKQAYAANFRVETHQGVFKKAPVLIKNIGIGSMWLAMITAVAKNDAIFTLFIAVI
jgi:hypothetical protein